MGAQGQEEIISHSSFEGVESAKRDCLLQAIRCGSLRLLLAKTRDRHRRYGIETQLG